MSLVESIAQAIAQMEGYNTSGSLAQRQNNPGNLRTWGSYPVVNGYVQFPDAETGWNALYAQIEKNIGRGLTLEEFFGGKPGVYGGYSPGADANDPQGYAQYVSSRVGIAPDIPLNAAGPPNPRMPPGKKRTPEAS
jgi:hypothetical protein